MCAQIRHSEKKLLLENICSSSKCLNPLSKIFSKEIYYVTIKATFSKLKVSYFYQDESKNGQISYFPLPLESVLLSYRPNTGNLIISF